MLERSKEQFGTSHTVVTYFPLNTLGEMSEQDVLPTLKEAEYVNLYVHIPFCKSKCGYCSYVSEPNASPKEIQEYLSALITELGMHKDLSRRKVGSVYIGGGTPTILAKDQLMNLIYSIYSAFDAKGADFCIETNPTVEKEKLDDLSKRVQRLSIGIQSFDDSLLKRIGRGYYTAEKRQKL